MACPSSRPAGRGGARATASAFTFVEVLFAIIIMGVGSIMIAGMLPVAIKQTSDTRNALAGLASCDTGYAFVKTLAGSDPNALPATNNAGPLTLTMFNATLADSPGRIVPLTFPVIDANDNAMTAPLFNMQNVTGSRVISSDPRSQWLAFYGRVADASVARLIVLGLRMQNPDVQSYQRINDATASTAISNGYNEPLLASVFIDEAGVVDTDPITGPLGPDTITFPASNGPRVLNALGTNAYVIVASAPGTTATDDRPYRNNGRVFRLGNRLPDFESGGNAVFELQPGYDLAKFSNGTDGLPNTPDDVSDVTLGVGTNTQVWLVGRGLANPELAWNATSNPYVGLVQDVAVLQVEMPLGN